MNSKQFLIIGGAVLVLVGLLGAVGVIGPTSDASIFGPAWWFDNAENWVHTVLGVVALLAAFLIPASLQKPLVMLVGVLGILAGAYSALGHANLLGANLEDPADTVLHIVVGAWAILASIQTEKRR